MADTKRYYVNKRTVDPGNVHLYRSSFLRLPDGIVGIEEGTFTDFKKLKSITFPKTLQYIGAHAFSGCSGLKSIELPNRVSRIDEEAFRECKNLESAVLPASLSSIPDRLFSDDGNYRIFIFRQTADYIRLGSMLFSNAPVCLLSFFQIA